MSRVPPLVFHRTQALQGLGLFLGRLGRCLGGGKVVAQIGNARLVFHQQFLQFFHPKVQLQGLLLGVGGKEPRVLLRGRAGFGGGLLGSGFFFAMGPLFFS